MKKQCLLLVFGAVMFVFSLAMADDTEIAHIPGMEYPIRCNFKSGGVQKSVACTDYNYNWFARQCTDAGGINEPVPATISNACRYVQTNSVGWQQGYLKCLGTVPSKYVSFVPVETCETVETSAVDDNLGFTGPRHFNRYSSSEPQQDVTFTYNSTVGYRFTSLSTASFALPAQTVAGNCYRYVTNGIPTNADFCDQTDINNKGYCELFDYGTSGAYKSRWWRRYNAANKGSPEVCRGGIDYHIITSASAAGAEVGTMIAEITTATGFKWDDHLGYQVTGCYNAGATKRFSCKNSPSEGQVQYTNCDKLSSNGSGACGNGLTPAGSPAILSATQYGQQVDGIGVNDCVRYFKKIGTVGTTGYTDTSAYWRQKYIVDPTTGATAWRNCGALELGKIQAAFPDVGGGSIEAPTASLESSFDFDATTRYFRVINSGYEILKIDDTDMNNKYTASFPQSDELKTDALMIKTNSGNITFSNHATSTNPMIFSPPVQLSSSLTVATTLGVSGTSSFTGAISANSISATTVTASSDKRLKKDFKDFSNPLDKILKLKGLNYKFRTDEFKDRNLPDNLQSGLIAQDTEKQLPEVISKDKDGFYSINYTAIVPYLIEALKEMHKNTLDTLNQQKQAQAKLEEQVKELSKDNKELKQRVDKLEQKK
jgi:hypothetical protein